MQNDLYTFSEIQISYKPMVKPSERPKITGAKDAQLILLQAWDQDKIDYVEQFKVIYLSRANRVIGIADIGTGGCAGVLVDPKVVFGGALKANASSIILAHNHPSHNMTPSQADITLTKKMQNNGDMLEVPVVDHVIVCSDPTSYYSFADNCKM